MEGMAGQRRQCRCGDNRRRCTVARTENLGSAILVGRLDDYGISGEHSFGSESTQIHSVSRGKAHFFNRQCNGAWGSNGGLFFWITITAIMPYTWERIISSYFKRYVYYNPPICATGKVLTHPACRLSSVSSHSTS